MENEIKRTALSFLKNSNVEESITNGKPIEKIGPPKLDNVEKVKVPVPGKKNPMKRKIISKKEKMAYALTIDPDIHKLLKLHASFTNIPMSQTVEELLTKFFEKNKEFKEELKRFME